MDYYPQFGFVLRHSSGPKLVIVVEDVLFVLSSDLWMSIMHPQHRVCSDFILCFWEYFISLKASIFLLPVSITVIQSFILMAPRETFVRRIDRGENVCWSQINGFILGVGLLIKHFFCFICRMEMNFISPRDEWEWSGQRFSDGPTIQEEIRALR